MGVVTSSPHKEVLVYISVADFGLVAVPSQRSRLPIEGGRVPVLQPVALHLAAFLIED